MTFDLDIVQSLFPGKYADKDLCCKIFNWIHGHYGDYILALV